MKINGLSNKDVAQRIEKGLTNNTNIKTDKSIKDIIFSNLFTYFNIIFFILAILVFISKDYRNLTFIIVVIINTLVGIFQEIRAKKILDKINFINTPLTTCIRDGQIKEIKSSDLVKDDIVIFKTGDQIVADALVIDGNISVNESLLTGEEDNIKKEKGSFLLSGSYVVSGKCYASLTYVGDNSYISSLAKQAKMMNKNTKSEMIRSIDKIIKIVGIIIIPLALALFYQAYYLNKETFSKSIISLVAAVIGMIPEGLYLLTTIALTLSTISLIKEKVLIHDMKSIEALARVDILCVDKTGTITKNEMEVSDIISFSNIDYKPLLKRYCELISDDNATILALRKYLKQEKPLAYNYISMEAFNSELKYSTVTFKEGKYILGAPEFIIDKDTIFQHEINKYTNKGYRVILFAQKDKEYTKPLSLIILKNEIRDNAKETFDYFKKQGVNVKVISGDNPKTVSEIARLVNIDNYEKYIDASLLNKEQLIEKCDEYTIFGRVSPKQKQILISALKDKGHIVAMTGDGVNDILALKEADCSIAMSSGAKATCEASQTVLLDSDFAHMPFVVYEGRRVVNNIQRSASLFLVKNIFSFLMSLFSLLMTITYPLEPNQVSLIAAFTIGIPGFLLALESNKNKIEGKFIHNILIKALPAGISDALSISIFLLLGSAFKIDKADIATILVMIIASIGFMILAYISKPFNSYKVAVFSFNILGFLLSFVFLKQLFSLSNLSNVNIFLIFIFILASIICYLVCNYIAIKIDKWLKDKKWKK